MVCEVFSCCSWFISWFWFCWFFEIFLCYWIETFKIVLELAFKPSHAASVLCTCKSCVSKYCVQSNHHSIWWPFILLATTFKVFWLLQHDRCISGCSIIMHFHSNEKQKDICPTLITNRTKLPRLNHVSLSVGDTWQKRSEHF